MAARTYSSLEGAASGNLAVQCAAYITCASPNFIKAFPLDTKPAGSCQGRVEERVNKDRNISVPSIALIGQKESVFRSCTRIAGIRLMSACGPRCR